MNTRKPICTVFQEIFENEASLSNTFHGARRIKQGARGKRTSTFPSYKNGGAIPVESSLELLYALVLERTPWVRQYRGNATYFNVSSGDVFPDFLIWRYDNKFEIHEVKPNAKYLSKIQKQKYEELQAQLECSGVPFVLIDVNDLPDQVTFAALLHHYALGHRTRWSQEQIIAAEKLLTNIPVTAISAMYRLLARNNLPQELAHYVLFHDVERLPHIPKSQAMRVAA